MCVYDVWDEDRITYEVEDCRACYAVYVHSQRNRSAVIEEILGEYAVLLLHTLLQRKGPKHVTHSLLCTVLNMSHVCLHDVQAILFHLRHKRST